MSTPAQRARQQKPDPAAMEFYGLRRGEGITIRFGTRATQFARVSHWTRRGACYVCKYRARSATWTAPIRIYPGEYVNRAVRMDNAVMFPAPIVDVLGRNRFAAWPEVQDAARVGEICCSRPADCDCHKEHARYQAGSRRI